MKQKVIIAVVAIVVIFGGIYLYVSNNKAVAPETSTNVSENTNTDLPPGDVPGDKPETNPTIPTSDTIAVSTQVPGDSVTIDNVYLSKPGFVDIHEATSNGQPGKSVGVSGLLGVGAKQDLEIKATLEAGKKYFAVIHVDNGDKKYTYPADAAAMKDGLPLQTLFSVSQ